MSSSLSPSEIRAALEAHAEACRVALREMRPRPEMPRALIDANLIGADLRDADLPTGYRIASLCFGGWPVTVTPEITTIGCQSHPNASWLAWAADAPEIEEMHGQAPAWWARHREAVCAAIRDVMSPEVAK